MGLKQNFAKKALDYDKNRRSRWNGKEVTVFSLFGAAIIGLIGGAVTSEFQPMDNSIKPNAEVAMTEYTAALDALSAAKGTYNASTPSPLQELIGSSEEANRHLQTMSQQDIGDLSKKFGTALLVDERLSEQQIHDLVTAFENRIGDFETFTGYDEPDYADLDEARASVKAQPTLEETATAINDSSRNDILNGDIALGGGAAGVLLALLMMTGIATNRRRLESWATEKPYKKQQHFNH
ncbi:MAG: hypothetical protein EP349_06460 [Alphaproteobacteria bacterium]|nr:MAG: hypothetical protein EP349_06460 [Alphaproteobacteria bacterium]